MTVIGDSVDSFELAIPDRHGATITLSWGVATDIGHKRALNEDSLVAAGTLFAVADGMGGHSAGDVASDAVVTRLAELAQKGFVQPESIVVALREATTDISHASDEQELGVGTTVTGAAITLHGGHPYWVIFNVGDSRLYLFEHNVLTQVTVDHSVVQELVTAGLITSVDAARHPNNNVVTRAVGFNAEPVPDFWLLPMTSHSRLLLCSDGLTGEVSELELRLHLAAGLGPKETAQALLKDALEAGGRDNVTLIVVDVLAADVENGEDILDVEDTAPSR
jgi:PPM family protein phosphatase